MSESLLKSMAEKLTQWDGELETLKGRAGEVAGERKEQFQKLQAEVAEAATQLKGKIDEYRQKSPDELKSEGEQLLRSTSGKVADGLKSLSAFFESKAQGGGTPPAGGDSGAT